MKNVLIAGATGETGKNTVEILNASTKFAPIAMIRKAEQKEQFEKMGVRTVMGDLTSDISDILEGMDSVIFAAGSKGENLEAVDENGAKKMVDASIKHGIQKFVMLSSIGADEPTKGSEKMQPYLQAKHNADEYLKGSGLNYTIVRPGELKNEAGAGKIKLAAHLNEMNSIPRKDVASTLVTALDNEAVFNATFEIVNGETPIEEAVRSYNG